jgi:hypothetical protein
MKTYEVIGPYPIQVIRDGAEFEVPPPEDGLPGGTFTEAEIEPRCRMELNIAAGLVKVVDDPAAAPAKGAAKAAAGAAVGGAPA